MADLPIYPSFHPATIKQGLSFAELARLAKDAGFRATAFDVEGAIAYDGENGPGTAIALLDGYGLEPSGWGGAPHVFASDADFEKGLRRLKTLAAFATDANAPNCMIFIPNRSGRPREEALELVAQRLKAIAEVLDRHGARLGIEWCGPQAFDTEPFEFYTGVEGTMTMAGAAGSANVGVVADSFHLFCSESKPEDLPSLAHNRVYGVHINDAPHDAIGTLQDADRVMPGDGVIDLGGFITALVRAGYAGPAEVELFNPKFRELDPLEVSKESRHKSERIIEAALA